MSDIVVRLPVDVKVDTISSNEEKISNNHITFRRNRSVNTSIGSENTYIAHIPNGETVAIFESTDAGRNVTSFPSLDSFMEDLES